MIKFFHKIITYKINFSFFIILVLIFLAAMINNCRSSKKKLLIDEIGNLQKYKDKSGIIHTKNDVIVNDTKDFLNLKTKDLEIINLQKLVKTYKKQLSNKGSAINFKSETNYDTIFKRKNYNKDSLETMCSNCNVNDSISNIWIVSHFGFFNDSVRFTLKVKNEYSVVIGEESQGWFKPKKTFVDIFNKNPYSDVKSLRAFQVIEKPKKKISIGPSVNLGVGLNLKPTVTVGLSFQYSIIKF